MKKSIAIVTLTWLILLNASACSNRRNSLLTDTINSTYKVGQVWRYNARSNEQQSTFTIVKVESNSKLGIIVHISIEGVHVKNPHLASGYSEKIAHMPFTKEAMDKSVVELLQENVPLPDYQNGYNEWRQAFDIDQAGVFSITVAEGINYIEQALNQ